MTPDTFWTRVDANGVCWEWTGALGGGGYGNGIYEGRNWQAHRLAWTMLVGPIPAGLQLDHLCRNRRCVNPDHLEVVTPRVNTRRSYSGPAMNARKTTCRNGHALDIANTYITRVGGRRCRACHNAEGRRDRPVKPVASNRAARIAVR